MKPPGVVSHPIAIGFEIAPLFRAGIAIAGFGFSLINNMYQSLWLKPTIVLFFTPGINAGAIFKLVHYRDKKPRIAAGLLLNLRFSLAMPCYVSTRNTAVL